MKNNFQSRKIIYVNKTNQLPIANFKQEDDAVLKLSLYYENIPLDCTGQILKLGVTRPDGTLVEHIDGFTINKNEIDIVLKNSIFLKNGKLECDLEIKDSSGIMTTASFYINCFKKVLNGETVKSSNEFNTFNKVVDEIKYDYENLRKTILDENIVSNLQEQINQTGIQLETIANKSTCNITDFPKLTGEENDTLRFKRALQYCYDNKIPTLYIKRGTYILNESVEVLCNLEGETSRGSSEVKTVLRFYGCSGLNIKVNNDVVINTIKNIQIQGDKTVGLIGCNIGSYENKRSLEINMDNVYFYGWDIQCKIHYRQDFSNFNNCTFSNPLTKCFDALNYVGQNYKSQNLSFENCEFWAMSTTKDEFKIGVDVDYTNVILLNNCIFDDFQEQAIKINECSGVSINGIYIEDLTEFNNSTTIQDENKCNSLGIKIKNTKGCVINGGFIYGLKNGIDIENSNVNINGVYFQQVRTKCIILNDTLDKHCSVNGVYAYYCGQDGYGVVSYPIDMTKLILCNFNTQGTSENGIQNLRSLAKPIITGGYSIAKNGIANNFIMDFGDATSPNTPRLYNPTYTQADEDIIFQIGRSSYGKARLNRYGLKVDNGNYYSRLQLGDYNIWVTSTGKLMIKNGLPTSETDGIVVGTQS